MFNDDDRIAQVTQLFQRADEPFVVALVQSDGRLVQDIQYVDQLRTNLCCQTDALTLTTRQRCRLAVQRQIVQTDFQ